jgi:hypothetical protein
MASSELGKVFSGLDGTWTITKDKDGWLVSNDEDDTDNFRLSNV